MIAKEYFAVVTLAACLLGLSVFGSPKHPVERPIKAHRFTPVVVSLEDGSIVAAEQGQGTVTGRYITHIVGEMDLSTFLVNRTTSTRAWWLAWQSAARTPPCRAAPDSTLRGVTISPIRFCTDVK